MRVTIKDVAREAGVSIATVSRVINGSEKVSEETRRRVIKAIKKLGYKPFRLSKPLAGNEPRIIGILVPDIFAYHYSDIAEGASKVLRDQGYETFVYMFHRRLDTELKALDFSFINKIEGLIVCTSEEDDEYLRRLEKTAIPVVTVDRENRDFRFDSVNIDNYKAGKMVAEYLFSKGHRRILHVTGDRSIFSVNSRTMGFVKKAKKLGMEVEVLEGDFEVGTAYDLVSKRLQKGLDFSAVFASADILAVEVIKALHDASIPIPNAVSVMGFDDAYFSRFTIPSLTTVRQPIWEMGVTAAQLLLSKLGDNHPKVVRKMILPVEIVERKSVSDLLEES